MPPIPNSIFMIPKKQQIYELDVIHSLMGQLCCLCITCSLNFTYMLHYTSKHMRSSWPSHQRSIILFKCHFISENVLMVEDITFLQLMRLLLLFLEMGQKMWVSLGILYFTFMKMAYNVSATYIPHIYHCIMFFCFPKVRRAGISTFLYNKWMDAIHAQRKSLRFSIMLIICILA